MGGITAVTAADGIASFGAAIRHIDVAIDDMWKAGDAFIGDELVKAADELDSGLIALVDAEPSQRSLFVALDRSIEDLRYFAESSATRGYAELFRDGPMTRGGNEVGRERTIMFLRTVVDGAKSQSNEALQLLRGA